MRNVEKIFYRQCKRVAAKLGNPRVLQIHFHPLRHGRAIMECHRTKDILHVMQLSGRRSIKSTPMYTQLINLTEDEYTCKVTKTVEEAAKLVESGFDYVTDIDSFKLFKKRK